MARYLLLWGSILGILVTGCRFSPAQHQLILQWARPTFPTDFKCLGVLVTGEGIPSGDTAIAADWQSTYNGGVCSYPGISTSFQQLQASSRSFTFELRVPSGNNRTVQIVGLTTSAATCPTSTVGDLLVANKAGKSLEGVTGIFELGRAYTDTQKTQAIEITNSFSSATAKDLLTCAPPASGGGGGNGGGGGPLAVPDSNITLFKLDRIRIKPTGGTPPYGFATSSGSISGNGVYLAPNSTGSTSISVTDSAGASQSVFVSVVEPASGGTIRYWFSAREFAATKTDNQPINNNENWVDVMGGLSTSHVLGGNGPTVYLESGGPKGLPVVEIDTNSYFHSISGSLNVSSATYVIARRKTNAQTGVFCISDANNCSLAGESILFSYSSTTLPQATGFIYSVQDYSFPVTQTGASLTAFNILSMYVGVSPDPSQFTVDYNLQNPANTNTSLTSYSPTGNLMIGATNIATGAEAPLQIAEVLVFSPPAADQSIIQTFLKAKYGF